MLRQVVLISLVIGAFGSFSRVKHLDPGFSNTGSQSSFDKSHIQAQKQANGTAAGAGTAGVGGTGDAQSLNTADHQAGDGKTQSKGQSLNQASGTGGVNAGGAAQAGGNTASQKQGDKQSGSQSSFQPIAPIRPIAVFQPNFGSGGRGNTGSTFTNTGSKFSKQDQSGGDSAGAGTATVGGDGNAQSLNTADHQAGGGKTQSKGQSLNQASGTGGVNAGGAAQAGGNTASQKQGEKHSIIDQFGTGNQGNQFGTGIAPKRPIGGFQPSGGSGNTGSTSGNQGSTLNKASQSGGNAAGAGTASVKDGQAKSDNKAEQFADEHGDRESGSSLNSASGTNPQTQGAAQTSGNNAQQKGGSKTQSGGKESRIG